MTFIFHTHQHEIPCTHIREYHRATYDAKEQSLRLAIKQYVPKDNTDPKPGDITIIGAHANGFPKELYEPLWEELYHKLKNAGIRIRGIWIADVAWQGYSSVLNEDITGCDPNWNDHSRDLFQMTQHFSAHMPRPIIGIGHSMGGANLTNLALIHPRLFTTLILFDPVIQRHPNQGNLMPARASVGRRDTWPSRAAAAEAFRSAPFYRTWDPRVLDLWLTHGLRDAPATNTSDPEAEHPVMLRTTRHAEVSSFLRPLPSSLHPALSTAPSPPNPLAPDFHPSALASPSLPFYRPEPGLLFAQLPHLRPSTLFLFGATSPLSTPALRADKLATTGTAQGGSGGVRAGRVAERLVDAGHLLPMEKVGECAALAAGWVVKEVRRFEEEEELVRKVVEGVPRAERGMLDKRTEELLRFRKGERPKL